MRIKILLILFYGLIFLVLRLLFKFCRDIDKQMLKPTTPKSPKEIIKEKERKRLLEKQVREEVRDELEKELYGVQSDSRESIPRNVKKEVWNRDDRKCVKCGSQKNLEFDHIIPVSKGGSNTARNVQILCKKCNREKSNNIG